MATNQPSSSRPLFRFASQVRLEQPPPPTPLRPPEPAAAPPPPRPKFGRLQSLLPFTPPQTPAEPSPPIAAQPPPLTTATPPPSPKVIQQSTPTPPLSPGTQTPADTPSASPSPTRVVAYSPPSPPPLPRPQDNPEPEPRSPVMEKRNSSNPHPPLATPTAAENGRSPFVYKIAPPLSPPPPVMEKKSSPPYEPTSPPPLRPPPFSKKAEEDKVAVAESTALKAGSEKKKKAPRSEGRAAALGLLTLAGDNTGAHLELGGRKDEKPFSGQFRKLEEEENGKNGNGSSIAENRSRKKVPTSMSRPMAAVVNSNVQGVNNSVLFNSTCVHRSPGVHFLLSSSNNRRPKEVSPSPHFASG